jgi:transposase
MEVFNPPLVKEKRPPGRQPTHSQEYMHMVARKVVEEGMTYREAAKTFGISHGAVHQWILKYKNQTFKTKRKARKTQYDDQVEQYRHTAQLKELKHEIAELYLENLMLKKALKHSLELKKLNSSIFTSENLAQLQELAK